MKSTCLLFALAPIIHGSTAFSSSSIHISKKHRKHPNAFKKANHANIISNIFQIRAGDTSITYPSSTTMSSMITPVTEALNQALVSGTPLRAIGALYAVASLTVVPLTYIRQAYSFSVGYGLSVATMAVALLSSFAFSDGNIISFSQMKTIPLILALNALVYGLRLSGFLLTREYTVESKKKQFRDLDKTPRFKRTPLALGVSLLYSFMTSPLLFALRGVGGVVPGSNAEKVQLVFTGISIFGMLLEAVADQHKYLIKKQGGKEGENKFVGPTTWSYKLCRHPNYFGEILFWLGLFGAGSVSFGKSVIAWICGSLGLWGILSIMLGASSRLDKKQNEKYGGQVAFEEWKKEVNSSVIPLIK